MKSAKDIKTALERSVKTLELKPSKGRVTRKATVRLIDGITAEAKDGDWTQTVDMLEMLGGNNTAASPSAFGRMALGSCMAMGYGMWFSRLGVSYDDIEVEVEGDLDFLGILGMDDSISPTHKEFRVRVNISSPAPREDVEQAVEQADRYSLMLNLIANPTPIKRELNLMAPAAEPVAVAT